ncbi:DNA mismatch repair endonuclease MutL [Candidatus Dependentiae bacterium]|nr:DNA mismatch repair endonuclease MutL [Candidatus Dependentiae bacterium]
MNKIKILPKQEAQKISAGEVVERPSSVVKEIIENSIDANSTNVSLYIEKAGKKLIRIIDNGEGMNFHDAKMCFKTHATSKISSINDLEKIITFGFRGEALASISAISRVELITKTNQDELGVKFQYESGVFLNEEKVSCPVGSDLQIKDLFFNTPARKKFLKQDETEWNQILNIFYAFCLDNLNVNFKLFRDNKLVFNIPAVEDLKNRISQLWGHNFSQNLVALKKVDNNLKITGYISNHNFWRYGRHQIFFFVNNRWVKNKELSKALLKGYLNVLPPARFPAAFIFLNLQNTDIDINVHPRKEEIKFSKPTTIELNLQRLIKETLEINLSNQLNLKKEIFTQKNNLFLPKDNSIQSNSMKSFSNIVKNQSTLDFDTQKMNDPIFSAKDFNHSCNGEKFENEVDKCSPVNLVFWEKIKFANKTSSYDVEKDEENINNKIIGQFLNTYILIEKNNGLLLVDQHAAHERILYEKFLNNFEKKQGTRLLFPETMKLNVDQVKMILREKKFLNNQGIEIDQIGDDEVVIKTSPPNILNQYLKDLILEIINFIEENENLEYEIFRKKLNEHMHSQLSCKMAVKAGDVLNIEQMTKLINDLQQTDNRFICAHGRPTTWFLSKFEIEKKFRRK